MVMDVAQFVLLKMDYVHLVTQVLVILDRQELKELVNAVMASKLVISIHNGEFALGKLHRQ